MGDGVCDAAAALMHRRMVFLSKRCRALAHGNVALIRAVKFVVAV